jgi:hypothetical protein
MVDILDSFNLTRNFWEVNPSFTAISEFKDFHKKDKTKEKARSSQTMWAIALLVHTNSKYANLSYADRLSLINDDFLEADKIELDPEGDHKDLIETFQKLGMSRTQRIARQWGDKLDERFKFIDQMPYNLENVEILDKMMQYTEKLWKQYNICLKDLEDERAANTVMGGATESLLEQNRI